MAAGEQVKRAGAAVADIPHEALVVVEHLGAAGRVRRVIGSGSAFRTGRRMGSNAAASWGLAWGTGRSKGGICDPAGNRWHAGAAVAALTVAGLSQSSF